MVSSQWPPPPILQPSRPPLGTPRLRAHPQQWPLLLARPRPQPRPLPIRKFSRPPTAATAATPTTGSIAPDAAPPRLYEGRGSVETPRREAGVSRRRGQIMQRPPAIPSELRFFVSWWFKPSSRWSYHAFGRDASRPRRYPLPRHHTVLGITPAHPLNPLPNPLPSLRPPARKQTSGTLPLTSDLRLPTSILGLLGISARLAQPVRQQDRQERGGHHEHGHHIGDRPVARLGQLAEDPDRQRGLLPGREGRDDDLVKR